MVCWVSGSGLLEVSQLASRAPRSFRKEGSQPHGRQVPLWAPGRGKDCRDTWMSLRKLTLEVEGLKVTVEGLTSSGSQQQPPSGLQSIRLNHPRSSTASSFDLVSEPGNSEAAYPQEPPLPVPFFAEDPTPLVGLGSPGSLSTAPHQPAGSIPALASGRSGYNRSLLPLSPPSSQPSTSQVPEYPLQGATAPSGLDQPPSLDTFWI